MALRNVERVEIVKVSFDLAIVFNGIAKRNEDVFDALPHQSDRVQVARARTATGDGYVQAFAFGARSFDAVFQESFGFLECLNNSAFGLLNQLTKRSAFFRRDPADQFLACREGALLPGMPLPQVGQLPQSLFPFFQPQPRTLAKLAGKSPK